MPMKPSTLLLVISLPPLVLSGCATLSPAVESSAHLPREAAVLAVESHQRLLLPAELGRLAEPVYPDAVPPRPGARTEVCLSFLVDEGGEVQDIRPERFAGTHCGTDSPEGMAPFWQAAEAAVRQWSFFAAAVCEFSSPEAAARSDEACRGADAIRPVAVRLAWIMRFRVDPEGRTAVTARR